MNSLINSSSLINLKHRYRNAIKHKETSIRDKETNTQIISLEVKHKN